MTKDEAWIDLRSTSPEDRLRAARYFSSNVESADVAQLRTALQGESVRWIKRALERAISSLCEGPIRPKLEIDEAILLDVPVQQLRNLRADAIDEVAQTILHEFAPLVGSLKLVAAKEVPAYDQSESKHFVEQLSALLAAVRTLKQAAGTPIFAHFDLAELVNECISVMPPPADRFSIRLAGAAPYIVHADRGSLGLAIVNGIRNAIEAVCESSTVYPGEILINWGPAGAENWLAIIDSGPGFSGNPADATKLGNTNKKDHFGYGLGIAQSAIHAIEGELIVSNVARGGARFELRWYKNYANTVR